MKRAVAASTLLIACGHPAVAAEPLTALPYTPGLDVQSMDTSAAPCEDFYQYACGGWMKNNPIPADQARWDVYAKLADENRRYLWGILETLSREEEGRSPPQALIGDLFASCMDERRVEAAGLAPLAGWLRSIDQLVHRRELAAVLAALHLTTGDSGFLFAFGQNPDYGDSTQALAFVVPGGLSLPDRDYYLQGDARTRGIRAAFVAHVAQVFALLGRTPAAARRDAATVLALETALARPQLTRVQQRDPKRLHNVVTLRGLRTMSPAFDWAAYLRALAVDPPARINVTEPAYLRSVSQLLATRPLAEWRVYLRWHLVRHWANQLPAAFQRAHFEFFDRTLRGIPEPRPRWNRCVSLVDQRLGDALGQEFVARTFTPAQKTAVERMTAQIESAMGAQIQALDWMSAPTKRRALEKLHGVVNKIGYPERWRDYRGVRITRDDLVGNVARAVEFEQRRDLAKIGRPVDRAEWSTTPPTVNAYYNPQMNDMNFPAGVLQPPLFDPAMDDAPNYGNTGGTIGHELIHGFDDEGRQFDAAGNLRNWWAPADERNFQARAQCLVDQYARYTIVDDIKINSRLTLGEDLADLGGLVLAFAAWKVQLATQPAASLREGFSPVQRFFIGFAQWACENARPEELRVNAKIEPHSPAKYRVNGVVVNMPEFAQAFACKAGQPMAPPKRCKVW